MSEAAIVVSAFFLACALGIVVAPFIPNRHGAQIMAWISSIASLLLLWAGVLGLAGHGFTAPLWEAPGIGRLWIALHHLGAVFLCVTALVYLPTSIFSATYLQRYRHEHRLSRFAAQYHALYASIAAIFLAGDVFSFLIAWEAMAILTYLLVAFEHRSRENAGAAYVMLAMSEAGTIAVLAAFLLLARGGPLDFASLAGAASTPIAPGVRWGVFLLSFLGFGVKAGLFPVNSWLPRAHPAAPAPVSAVLSGVILNLGVYGILLVNGRLLPVSTLGPGILMLALGALTALIGILYASTNDDMKVMLAYSSIENIGLVVAALGAGFVFTVSDYPTYAVIAAVAGLYHLVNHSIYKALLFLGAGSVDVLVGCRDMNRLGGLIRFMPWTAFFFLVGAMAISALPPLNGFVSEWLLLETLLRSAAIESVPVRVVFALCGAAVALTAALALTCFAKAFAMSFLGVRRDESAPPHEAARPMLVSMGMLAAFCLLLGILPTYVIPSLGSALGPMPPADVAAVLVPPFFEPTTASGAQRLPADFVASFHALGAQLGQGLIPGRGLVVMLRGGRINPVIFAMSTSYMLLVLVLLMAGTYFPVRWLVRRSRLFGIPWNGGLPRVLPETTYTAAGFSNPIRVIFEGIFRPTIVEDSREVIAEHFRVAIRLMREDVYLVDRIIARPIVAAVTWFARTLALMHHGRLNAYVAYVFLTLMCVLLLSFALSHGSI